MNGTLELSETKTEITIEQKVANGIAVFNSKKDELTLLAEKCTGLKVTDINDKKQLTAVSNARKELKAERCEIQNQGKEIRSQIAIVSKQVTEKEKELTGIISPIEDELQAEEDRVQAEKDRIIKEDQEKEAERVQARVASILNTGCVFDGISYTLGEMKVPHVTLVSSDDVAFNKIVSDFNALAVEIEAKRLQDERIKAEADEAERKSIAAEKKKIEEDRAELERLRKQHQEREQAAQVEADRIKAEQAQREAKIQEEARALQEGKERQEKQQADVERERINAIVTGRVNELKSFGLVEYSTHYGHPVYDCTAIEKEIIQKATINDWEETLSLLSQRIDEGKAIAEEKRLADIEAVKEQARKEEQERIQAAQRLQAEQEVKEKAEAARVAALAPDKEKLVAFANMLGKLELPVVNADAAKTIATDIQAMIAKMQNHIHSKTKAL